MHDRVIDWVILLRAYAKDPVSNIGMYQRWCSPLDDKEVQ
jgi:hypothetical protein